ncbi:uncharacterized protein LOC133825407 [Humulus lupulus]|uniref:uncharacterized protein LOC133825407 n=1 Tax=Humulus lupulus TaxID=3486 RepID=UPI002B412E8D|nr:uncharacterized protein LOC133825407 [Humulus lupulus]
MARRKTKPRNATTLVTRGTRKRGPNSSDKVLKAKAMDEILGVEAIEFDADDKTDEEGELGVGGSKVLEGVKIELDDIEDEIAYWNSALVCYVLGENPALSVFEGFTKRVWKDKGVDKIGVLAKRVFIIRFEAQSTKYNILNGGYMFFDRKPVVMKPWDAYTDYKRKEASSVPIWLQLHGLDLKYWGKKALFKILGQQEIHLTVHYEWLPITCRKCSGMGHLVDICTKEEEVRQKWVVKKKVEGAVPLEDFQKKDKEGFLPVTKGRKVIPEVVRDTKLTNSFQILEETRASLAGQVDIKHQGGGDPPCGNG